jgi:LuxR family maltose regulon positive regulatory protein
MLESPPRGRCIFIYDDFHLIRNKAILRFIERSVTSSFPTITSILISRTEPDVNLIKLLSKGLLGRITEEDLRFSREEMIEYFRIQQIQLLSQTASSIYQDTEGWAFAIHLAALSLKNAPPGTGYVAQAMRSNIFKLLESEIMAVISADLRKFLIKLSLIEHLVPDLLREIASPDAARGQKMIEELEQIVSFVRFDTYQNTYQIHHLLLEYLLGKQWELSDAEKREIYRKAAAWCAANNQKMDAFAYCEKAGDYERLIDMIETMTPLLPNRTARALLEIMERAPEEIYSQIAQAQVLRTGLYLILEMFDKSREELVKIIGKLETQPLTPTVTRTLTGCYNNLGFIGLNTSPYTRDYDYVHYFEKALHYYNLNRFETGPPITIGVIGSYLCRVNTEEKGEMEKYIAAVSAMVPLTSVTFGGCGLGMDDLGRGELAFFKGDLSGAEHFILQALRSARQGKQYETENRALFYLLRINLAWGNYQAIGELLKQLEAQLEEQYYPNRFINYDIVTGWYYAQTGQENKMAPWLKDDFEESDLNSIVYGLEVMVKAKFHFVKKHYPAALAALEGREGWNSRWNFVLGRIERKVMEAVCRYQLKDRKAAFAALEEAYRLAHPNVLYMPFMEMGKDMRALAGSALKDQCTSIPAPWLERICRNASAYARKLFLVAEHYREQEQGPGNKVRTDIVLSRREKEVLTGLSQGLTREEIASFSSISVNTVKSVIRSVYNKLGAVNRADAVRIAASLGLV